MNTLALFIILFGQSNTSSGLSSELPRELRTLSDGDRVYYVPEGRYTQPWEVSRFGPEVGLLRVLDTRATVIKHVRGGTSIQEWAPSANGVLPPLYKELMLHTKQVLSRSVPFEVVAVFVQGERDARESSMAKVYGQYMNRLAARLRKELNAPEMPIILSLSNPPTSSHPAVSEVQRQQTAFVERDGNACLVPMTGLPKRDGIHLTSDSQLIFGARIARCLQ